MTESIKSYLDNGEFADGIFIDLEKVIIYVTMVSRARGLMINFMNLRLSAKLNTNRTELFSIIQIPEILHDARK